MKRLLLTCALALAASPALLAHHSFAAFDMAQTKTITGVVSRFDWTNPHTFIWVDVPNEKGVVESWAIEGMSPNYLGRRGWSKHSVKPGEKITVTIHPLKEGKTGGMFMRAQIGDRVLMPTGAPTDER
jgi:Cu/Ag efflux protein CusF